MREGGLEPPSPFGHRDLNPARLPVPPLSRGSRLPCVPAGSTVRSPLWNDGAVTTPPGPSAAMVAVARARRRGVRRVQRRKRWHPVVQPLPTPAGFVGVPDGDGGLRAVDRRRRREPEPDPLPGPGDWMIRSARRRTWTCGTAPVRTPRAVRVGDHEPVGSSDRLPHPAGARRSTATRGTGSCWGSSPTVRADGSERPT